MLGERVARETKHRLFQLSQVPPLKALTDTPTMFQLLFFDNSLYLSVEVKAWSPDITRRMDTAAERPDLVLTGSFWGHLAHRTTRMICNAGGLVIKNLE